MHVYLFGVVLALLKTQVSLQLGISSDNEVSICIMYLHIYWLLHKQTAKTETLSDELISHNMYECFMNTYQIPVCMLAEDMVNLKTLSLK